MIGNDFETPIMYQDLTNYTMGPMYMPFAGVNPYANSNLLGGTMMPRQLDHDKLDVKNAKENEDKSTAKKVLTALGVILTLGAIPIVRKNIIKAGGIGKYLSNKWTSIVNFVKGNKTKPSKFKRFKVWCSNKWTAFKSLFKRNKQVPNNP